MFHQKKALSPNASFTPSSPARLQKTLVLWQLIMIGLAYMQPMTVFDTFGIVSDDTGGHVPTAYIITLIAMMFTALSYGKMVRYYPSAGSAYTYAQRSLNPNLGFVIGWCTMLDYLFNPMINILLATIYLKTLISSDISIWFYVVPLAIVMTYINYRGVELVANVNTLIVFCQLLLMGIFLALVIKGLMFDGVGAGTITSVEPFFTPDMQIGAVAAGSAILCFSFLGFDGLSSLSEETKNAARTVPRAIFLTTFIGGLIFIGMTYFMQLYFKGYVFQVPDESQPEILLYVGEQSITRFVAKTFLQSVGLWLAVLAVCASGIAAHTGVSRMMYVMGRDGVLPTKIFGYINPKYKTPSINIIIVGVICLTAGFFDLNFALHLVNFGALTAFFFVNLCVVVQYYIRDKQRYSVNNNIQYLIFPFLGMAFISYLWYSLEYQALVIGLVWATIGIIYLAFVTRGFTQYPKEFLSRSREPDA
ncbi:APC family permease [Ignatzschineria larvae DSM 13226]|uniref:APC family permease n=1 Tax=Ignatzschineria larvae DSM 13226 TaxID=1111732 RepID=A0ABZ3C2A6_9GAMM|nr:APC family permease [Ignatzschineria larvae]